MVDFAEKYGSNVTSQNGENGIIAECIKRINPELKIAIEVGAPDRMYCSNIFPLEKEGWDLFYFDNNTFDPYITRVEITPENINDVVLNCSVLSIDIDGNDYAVWAAYKREPDIVVVEINSSISPHLNIFTKETGASFRAMLELGQKKWYFLLCHTGNMVFVHNRHKALFPEIDNVGAYSLFNKSWLC